MKVIKNVRDEVADILLATGDDYLKNGRALSKSVGRDKRFNTWLQSGGKLGIAVLSASKEALERSLEIIGKNSTEVKQKQALIVKMLETDIAKVIAAKDKDVTKGLILDETQKAAHTKVLEAFAENVNTQARRALIQLGIHYGVVEATNAKEKEAVKVPVVAE